MRRFWGENATPITWLGLGLGIGLLLSEFSGRTELREGVIGVCVIAMTVVGALWLPIADRLGRTVSWLPTPPLRPREVRAIIADRPPRPGENHDNVLWLQTGPERS